MARTPQEIFQHHGAALMAGDVDEIVADYTDDSVFITPRGVLRGKAEIRQAFTDLLAEREEMLTMEPPPARSIAGTNRSSSGPSPAPVSAMRIG